MSLNLYKVYYDSMSKYVIIICVMFSLIACAQKNNTSTNITSYKTMNAQNIDTITLGAGCFWCVEAVFQQLNGVISVTSGYSNGHTENPTYKEVCTGTTGHAEVAQIVYNPAKITLDELLEVFWQTHDPTTLNKQGNDEGTQYRSAIFYHNQQQKETAEKYKNELNASGSWDNPVVTEILPLTKFYKAENYHQNYFNQNGDQAYCTYVIRPKLEKFRKVFKDKLKPIK